jgi:predicted RNase H-like HicB family nuclease
MRPGHPDPKGRVSLGMRLTVAITREENWYVGRCLEVEIATQGKTVEETLANVREALELYFKVAPKPCAASG